MTLFYDRQLVPLELLKWAELMGDDDYRRIAFASHEGTTVSTVWVGFDLNPFPLSSAPLIFETMVFGGEEDHLTLRWPTEDTARAGHAEVVRQVFK